ncbi:DUF726 domain-containing protein [Paracoccus sp. M683]|uniref:DUF726 domain-containing protein n=1 Tax=Paracoccus sp. M683 TaxID=2594268 RepID=UPI00117D3D00|nr:DUF726 domain-containing protein [Paracoccus sp. M683]TRW94868.1 DUF726 domain-containing protein [Paracoccus sp. M683]
MAVLHHNSDLPVPPGALQQAAALASDAPIIVMVHGYRFSPHHPRHDPHRHILSLDPAFPATQALSWPRALGFRGADETGPEGLAIGFGWEARGSLRAAYRRAGQTGDALARMVDALSQAGGRPVALIGHSLGARVMLSALRHSTAGAIGRMVLMAGAEFRCAAAAALDSPAGEAAEVLNITSRENDLFDFGLELLVSAARRQALGFGLENPRPNWIDIQIDDADTLAMLAGLGFPMDRRARRLSHWTPYLRGGVFDFYRTALRQPWALPLNLLRRQLPAQVEPRWSRLLAPPERFGGRTA